VHDRQQSDFRNHVAGELSMPRRANEIVLMLLLFEVAEALRGIGDEGEYYDASGNPIRSGH